MIMNLKKASKFVVAVTFAFLFSLLCGFWVYATNSNDSVSLSASTKKPPYTTEAADKRGMEIMELSGTWGQTMEEVLPYMSNAGIDKAVEIYNQKHDIKKKASDFYNTPVSGQQDTKKPPYTTEAADKRGMEIMELSGTWGQTMEEVLPYMSNAGIDKAVEIYNQKHDIKKKASDFYNTPVSGQ